MAVKLFVGGLSFSTSNERLREVFAATGSVESAAVVTDRDTGRSRGFGFVEMANDDEAKKAITGLDGKDVAGRNIKVNEAHPRAERTGPPATSSGGGRGRGGFSTEDYGGAARQPREPRW